MPIVLRYVDSDNTIKERFIEFVYCNTGTTGQALSDKIIDCLVNKYQLDIQNCRGQCYDGAGNMAGKYSGVSARILQINPLAMYTHCASHRLNLCVASAFNDQNVSNMMDRVRCISDFFNNSPRRQQLLEHTIKNLKLDVKHTKLLDVCRTRWILRIDGLARFLEMYEAIVETMLIISQNSDRSWNSCAGDASSFWSLLLNFNFLFTLTAVRNCLGYTHSATEQLQGPQVDILKGLQMIKITMCSLQTARTEIDFYHQKWFDDASEIARKVGAPIVSYRVCKTQIYRSNSPSLDVSNHCKTNISIPFLDHLLQEFLTRFSTENCIALSGIAIIPAVLRSQYKETSIIGKKRSFVHENDEDHKFQGSHVKRKIPKNKIRKRVKIQRLDRKWKRDFEDFCNQYANDMPDVSNISHEVDNWESFWVHVPENTLPSTIAETLHETDPTSFPNISTALRLLAVFPFTSCSCERSASAIRLLKTYTRSNMSQERLNGLATLYTHKDVNIDVEEVIDRFAATHPRRLSLVNLLGSNQNLNNFDDAIESELY